MISSSYFLPAVLLASVWVADLSGQQVANGDFESPGFLLFPDPGYAINEPVPGLGYSAIWDPRVYQIPTGSDYLQGWTIAGGTSVGYEKGGTSGNYHVRFTSGAAGMVLSQQIWGFQSGATYHLRLDLLQNLLGASTAIKVQIGGQSWDLLNSAVAKWQTHVLGFTAPSEALQLSISAPSAAPAEGIHLDNVRIDLGVNPPIELEIKHVFGLAINGEIGETYRVEYTEDWGNSWVFLQRVTLTNASEWLYYPIDLNTIKRFCRAVKE